MIKDEKLKNILILAKSEVFEKFSITNFYRRLFEFKYVWSFFNLDHVLGTTESRYSNFS